MTQIDKFRELPFYIFANFPFPHFPTKFQRPLQAEIQQIRQELDRREKDINELMADNDFLDMEDELRRLRKQVAHEQQQQHHYPPKDYTDKSLSSNEFQTMKMKLEKSELSLAEKTRELTNTEIK